MRNTKQFAAGTRVKFTDYWGTHEGVVEERTSQRIIVQADNLFRHRFVRKDGEWLRATPYIAEQANLREI